MESLKRDVHQAAFRGPLFVDIIFANVYFSRVTEYLHMCVFSGDNSPTQTNQSTHSCLFLCLCARGNYLLIHSTDQSLLRRLTD